jgi:tripartite-type tricarboxylate transporter receptor subunit TctC
MKFRAVAVMAAVLACAATTAEPAGAQSFPIKPIRFVVAFTPGGGADVSARIIAQKASEILGQPIVIDNRPGAGGNIAADVVAKAAPDGYTLLQTTVAHAIGHSLYKKLSYDYLNDFVAVAALGSTGFVLAVNKSLPAQSVQAFVAHAKAHTGELDYSSSGIGGPSHLATELFKSMTGIKMQHIPYKGVSPAVTDLMGGRVQATFVVLPTALPLMQSGDIRGLGLSSAKRSELAPDLPTIAEQGLPGFEATTWYGALAPASTPAAVIDKLDAAFTAAFKDAGVRARLKEQGFDLEQSTRREFAAYIKSETEKWTGIVKAVGANVE